jgi:hypothetical protein
LAPVACDNHADLLAAAFGADQPFAPIEHSRFGAIPSGHLGEHRRCDLLSGIGLDLVTAPSSCTVEARRRVHLRRRQGLAGRLGSELGEDRRRSVLTRGDKG